MKIFVLLAFLLFPFSAFAQSVLINEIAWMGTPVAGVEENQWWRYEWFELFNATDQPVVLEGWAVELSRDKLDFMVSLTGTIVPNGYYVVGASDKIPDLDLNYKNLGGKFFNGGQRVVLKNSLGEIIDELDVTSGSSADEAGWPAGDNKTKQTMELVGGASHAVALAKAWQTSKEPGGTPKAPNSEGIAKNQTKPGLVKDKTEKDLSGRSDSDESSDSKRSLFQSRVPLVNPITLLAGLLALGFSGVLLLVKRSLALRQRSGQASRQARLRSRQERQQS